MKTIDRDEDTKHVEEYTMELLEGRTLEIEHIYYEEWEGMNDHCPECQGTEFDHMRYEGGHYAQYRNTVIERSDYWDQKGSLYTACRGCGEILYKSPAYDVLEAFEQNYWNSDA